MSRDHTIERRKFPRYTHDLPVAYQTLAADLGLACPHCGGELLVASRNLDQLLISGTARTQTLSLGGMSMEIDRSFAPGKQMLLQMALRDELVTIRAVVVMCQRGERGLYRMGVEFQSLSELHRQVLVDYFADNLLREARDRTLQEELSSMEKHGDPMDPRRPGL